MAPPPTPRASIQIFKAAVAQGHEVRIAADGPDESEAVATLVGLIESNFGE
jgi:phosphotransferase system HPr-like phosphotransfer protein